MSPRGLYNNISTATTTTVKSGPGVLRTLTINTTVASAVTVYDSTTGSGATIATFPASAVVGTYHYNLRFKNGLTIVTAGNSNITVTYD